MKKQSLLSSPLQSITESFSYRTEFYLKSKDKKSDTKYWVTPRFDHYKNTRDLGKSFDSIILDNLLFFVRKKSCDSNEFNIIYYNASFVNGPMGISY